MNLQACADIVAKGDPGSGVKAPAASAEKPAMPAPSFWLAYTWPPRGVATTALFEDI